VSRAGSVAWGTLAAVVTVIVMLGGMIYAAGGKLATTEQLKEMRIEREQQFMRRVEMEPQLRSLQKSVDELSSEQKAQRETLSTINSDLKHLIRTSTNN
jgi:TolA-binding protein